MSRGLTPEEKRDRAEQIVRRFVVCKDTTEEIARARGMSIGEVNRTLRAAGVDPGPSPIYMKDVLDGLKRNAHRCALPQAVDRFSMKGRSA